ncbi:hypothetical protein DL764_003596 [Monosporascus ibericus]|uniref:Uncharacterized protein n=1 Tax=Monosporascus ibericus TaxID=155417 RepID=A0A4Q4TGL4_9PEZI|nr:hypothetical protein DL764_003596 [Monosporascus ibericus]
MAEVIAAIGTAGALANIIDVVGKTIVTLNDLRNAWNEAELTLLCLESELGALRTAFARIQDWVDTDDADLHHLLVMDLGRSMTCCRLLMSKIDGEMLKLQHHPDDNLPFPSKTRLVFGKKGIEKLESLIQRQTSSLTLLLTVCNCKTMSEQKMLLEKPKTRKVFRKIEHDTESMIVHRDKNSILSHCTDNVSKLSMVFDFDQELFISRVYGRVLRASLKGAIRREQAADRSSDPNLDVLSASENSQSSSAPGLYRDHSTLLVRRAGAQSGRRTKVRVRMFEGRTARREAEAKERSQAIDRSIFEDWNKLRRETKVLLLGTASSGKDEILNQIRNTHLGGSSEYNLELCRPTIYRNVLSCAKTVVQAMEKFHICPELDANKEYCEYLRNYQLVSNPNERLDAKVGEAIASLWEDPCIQKLVEHRNKSYLTETATYFFNEIHRIAAPDYLPNEMDVLRARPRPSGIQDVRFETGQMSIHLIDVGERIPELKKWINCFENVITIIVVVNLAGYDQVPVKGSSPTQLVESLMLFESIVNSRWFRRTSIVLPLNKVDLFKQKLPRSPLADYFPDFLGGKDVNKAAKYIVRRFEQSVHDFWDNDEETQSASIPSQVLLNIRSANGFKRISSVLERVGFSGGLAYREAVEHCIKCDLQCDNESLDDEEFRDAVYYHVVAPLHDAGQTTTAPLTAGRGYFARTA